ncbi:hypothetical protein COO91_04008 [Nostoc flagelliforme CCNUN1]|uniref:Uncharacterized protein n=1 Tax=Nostoc flagelliforme CCNUN1 TaxID=2038116 RepID=A0A2K8SRK7_9NOSO|nr:hypothetical protein COO91_04008 [Nostoc flagelliforme CCNUN1]
MLSFEWEYEGDEGDKIKFSPPAPLSAPSFLIGQFYRK